MGKLQEDTGAFYSATAPTLTACGLGRGWRGNVHCSCMEWLSLCSCMFLHYPYHMPSTISACANSTQWRRSLDVWEMMQKCSLRPNSFTLSAILAACQRAHGQWPRGLELLRQFLVTRGSSSIDSVAVAAVLQLCAAGAQWQLALHYLQQFDPASSNLTNMEPVTHRAKTARLVGFNAAMAACEKGWQWQHCLELLLELQLCTARVLLHPHRQPANWAHGAALADAALTSYAPTSSLFHRTLQRRLFCPVLDALLAEGPLRSLEGKSPVATMPEALPGIGPCLTRTALCSFGASGEPGLHAPS